MKPVTPPPSPRPNQEIRAYPLHGDVRVEIVEPNAEFTARRASLSDDIERVWAKECRANPRLHDGPILSVTAIDRDARVLTCIRDSYKNLVAVQCGIPNGTRSLGVSGVLMTDELQPRILIGQRGPQTRMYQNLDEFAPGGGVRPPQDQTVRTLNFDDLCSELLNEAHEELDGCFAPDTSVLAAAPKRLLGFCEDDTACWVSVVIGVSVLRACIIETTVETPWEYTNRCWRSIPFLEDRVSHAAEHISPLMDAVYSKFIRPRG